MKLQATTVVPISEKQSRVEMLFHDAGEEATAETLIRLRVTVNHQANSGLAAIQAKALRRMQDALADERGRIESLGGLSPGDHA